TEEVSFFSTEQLEGLTDPQLVELVHSAGVEEEKAFSSSFRWALVRGRVLSFKKGVVGHGAWGTWLKKKLQAMRIGNERTATDYVLLWGWYHNLPQQDWPKSIQDGLQAIRQVRKDAREKDLKEKAEREERERQLQGVLPTEPPTADGAAPA